MSENGKPTTCSEENKGLFEFSKAKNILDHLPKTLQKLKFKVEAVPDIPLNKKVIKKDDHRREEYILTENIAR